MSWLFDSSGSSTQCDCTSTQSGFTPYTVTLASQATCADMGYELVRAVHFADLDGDGLKDYIWVGATGQIQVFRNLGASNQAQVAWQSLGQLASGEGARQNIRFGDLNGDGRADYLVVNEDGSVQAWLNGGLTISGSTSSINWMPQGTIAAGIGMPGSSIRFADLNGDGRDDYLAIGSSGAVHAYLNGVGNGGQPNWIDQGQIASGVGSARASIVFADINGDGRCVPRSHPSGFSWSISPGRVISNAFFLVRTT